METLPGDDGFKNLPLKIFDKDVQILQKLHRTVNVERQKLTLRDLLRDVFPERDVESSKH